MESPWLTGKGRGSLRIRFPAGIVMETLPPKVICFEVSFIMDSGVFPVMAAKAAEIAIDSVPQKLSKVNRRALPAKGTLTG